MQTDIISQQGTRQQFDVIVIGSGIAALSYILELTQLNPNLKIALLTKITLVDSNTYYAQGGIAAVFNAEDTVNQHVKDTLQAGDGLCNQQAVNAILEQGRASIEFLQNNGVLFDRSESGELSRGREAGHSERRIYHCGDQTGAFIASALISQIKKQKAVTIFEQYTAINLITNDLQHQPGSVTEVVGLYALANVTGLIHTFLANVVVLATGGAGKVYRYTTNPDVATGDGVAMAYRAGARVGNMEFYQFHPTLLYHPKINNFLISEALRGEGAYLRLANTGERFMQRYAPQAMELATRDIVARAIFSEIEQSDYDFVCLDIRHKDKQFLQQRFPIIYQTLLNLGLDLSKDLIPVVPAAHYLCGGVLTDTSGRTDLARLYAIGEVAFTGLHGANRLASNSLLEGIVMGRNAAQASREWVTKKLQLQNNIQDWKTTSVIDTRRSIQINAHWRGLRGEMSAYAGIIRTEAGLQDLLRLVSLRRNMIEKYYWDHLITRDLIELRNISLVAELIVKSALRRHESRGNHFREDYPQAETQPEVSLARASHLIGDNHYEYEQFYNINLHT